MQYVALFQIRGPTDLDNFEKYPKDRNIPPDETSGWDKDFWKLKYILLLISKMLQMVNNSKRQ